MAYSGPIAFPVREGGTGDTSFTTYAPVCGGTTTTGALQSAGTGISNSGYVFTSNGSAAFLLASFRDGVEHHRCCHTNFHCIGTYTPTAGMISCYR